MKTKKLVKLLLAELTVAQKRAVKADDEFIRIQNERDDWKRKHENLKNQMENYAITEQVRKMNTPTLWDRMVDLVRDAYSEGFLEGAVININDAGIANDHWKNSDTRMKRYDILQEAKKQQ